MKVSPLTLDRLRSRRFRRDMREKGYEEVTEHGGNLWKLHRGAWYDREIVSVEIDPDGRRLWVKIEPRQTA
jgi:hypothetical protein